MPTVILIAPTSGAVSALELPARVELAVALADTTSARWKTLRAVNAVSAQEADDKLGDATARRAHVQALSANVERMQQMQRYAKLVAPFDGMSRRATSMWAR